MATAIKKFRFKKAELGLFESKYAIDAVELFEKNCRILGLTRGNFSLIDLIHATLKKTGPADVICVTWSAGIKDVNNVKWMVDSSLIKSFKLITDHSYVSRKGIYLKSIEEIFGKKNIFTSEIHAKFCLIANKDYTVTIRTSMNLNANKTCENFEIDEDFEIYSFYKDFVCFLFENQDAGFLSSSETVNTTLDLFFKQSKRLKIGK